jgi:EmrB/QacA subfamily drug resistance transporter
MTVEQRRLRVRPGAELGLLCMAQFMVVLDVTIVAIALPRVQADLGFTTTGLAWVVTAYTLSFGGLLIVAGRAGDLFGHRRLFAAGLAVFGVASLVCGLAWSPAALVGARVVQGVGAAMVAPTALALLNAAFPDGTRRRRALGWWTAAAAGGGACGWLLGGLLTDGLGWRWVFLVNVPVAILAAAAARLLTETPRGARVRLDLVGAAALTCGLAALIYGATHLPDRWAVAAVVVAAALLTAFGYIERHAAAPMLPPAALRSEPLTVSVFVAATLTATTTPVMFLAVLYQQQILGAGALLTGAATAPFNLAVVAGAALGARLPARADPRLAMAGGLVLVAAGAWNLVRTGEYLTTLLPTFVLMGVGLGVASVASTGLGTDASPGERRGLASGLLTAAAQLGTVLGLAALVPLAAGPADSPLTGYHAAYAWAGWAATAGALLALGVFLRRRRARGA